MDIGDFIAGLALCWSIANSVWNFIQNKENKKDKFITNMRDNIIGLRTSFVALDVSNFTDNIKKKCFTDSIQKYTLYQIYEKQKKAYLTLEQQKQLFNLQQDAEDYFGRMIQIDTTPENIEIYKTEIISTINAFLKSL